MKKCIITGGGSKFGQQLVNQLIQAGYVVDLITGTPDTWANNPSVNVISVDWKTIGLQNLKQLIPKDPVDLMFFNHNSSALSGPKFKKESIQSIKDWQQSYFVSCQLPFYLIHSSANKISPNTKIGWMLSELVNNPVNSQVGYADYIGYKFTNTCIMRSFSLNFPACFFGIIPGLLDRHGLAQDLIGLIHNTDIATLNGGVFNSDGSKFEIGHQNT